jgi:hypothetical protein
LSPSFSHLLSRVVLGLAALGACEPAPPRIPPPPSATAAPTSDALPPVAVYESLRFGASIAFPAGEPWKVDDATTPWLTATQAAHSTLLLRTWPSENRMNRDKCEAQARARRELPVRDETELLEVFDLDAPPGFDTQVEVRLTTAADGTLFGIVLGFGGSRRRCFALTYVTQDRSTAKDRVVADRLAVLLERSIKTLRFTRDTDAPSGRDAPP